MALGLPFSGRKLQFRRHSNQFCQGFVPHFPHHVAAMNLDGDLADPELKSDLLIEHTRNHQAHDFALARAQGLVTFSQPGIVTLLAAPDSVAIQSLLDCVQQVLVVERLGQKLHGTRFHGLHRHRNVSVTGNKNNWDLDARVGQLTLKVQTIDAGKVYIQNQATWPLRSPVAQEFFRRPKGFGPQARRLQQSLDGGTHGGIVINDEYRGSVWRVHSLASALAGRVKEKLAPRGELLAAHKRPSCDSTMDRLMDSPMPVP